MSIARAAIIGTAQSYLLTPWTDAGLYICSLNDAYRLKGFVRADAWYDLHPLNRFMWHDGKTPIAPHQVPAGYYLRPAEYLDWLSKLVIPAFLHPDYAQQHEPAKTWPRAAAFPKAQIEASFGRYFTSSPAWMLAHLMAQGCRDVTIYGIHLATEHEYIDQRPQFEFLIGRMLGPQRMTITVADKMRHYQTADGHVALPEASPLLSSDFQYAFEIRPRSQTVVMEWDQHRYTVKRERAIRQLTQVPWWRSTRRLREDLWTYEAHRDDAHEQIARMHVARQWSQAAEG